MQLWADLILPFIPDGEYLIWASVCRAFRTTLIRQQRKKITYIESTTWSWPLLLWGLQQGQLREKVCTAIARHGNLPLFQKAWQYGCPFNSTTIIAIARSGHLEMLQWALEHDAKWHVKACAAAAEKGHPHILKWARACSTMVVNGYWARVNDCFWDECTCSEAAHHGHLEVLQWARTNGCPWNERTCLEAARHDVQRSR